MSLFAYNGSPTRVGMGRAHFLASLTASSSESDRARVERYADVGSVFKTRPIIVVESNAGAMSGYGVIDKTPRLLFILLARTNLKETLEVR